MGSCGVVGLRVRDFPISHNHTDTGQNLDLQFIYPKTKLEAGSGSPNVPVCGWWMRNLSKVPPFNKVTAVKRVRC